MPKLVYIGGPLRAPTVWQMEQNIREAEALAMEVFAAGAYPVCVHSIARFTEERRVAAMAGSVELLRRCDALVVSARWRDSAGTAKEIAIASEQQRPIFYAEGSAWLPSFSAWLGRPSTEDTED